LIQETLKPANCNNLAVDEVITPLPSPDITPPVIKINFGLLLCPMLASNCTLDFS
jgi:hypothetical protein